MAISNIRADFQMDIQIVWDVVTSLEHYSWRSDLDKIKILNEKQFVEFTKEGIATTFTTTLLEPYKRWEFDMDNDNMKGHWIGIFTQNGKYTEVEFTENVVAKKIIMKPFAKAYLKTQQANYVTDLKEALSKI